MKISDPVTDLANDFKGVILNTDGIIACVEWTHRGNRPTAKILEQINLKFLKLIK